MYDDRSRIDPYAAHPSDGLRRAEARALEILDAAGIDRITGRARDVLEIHVPLDEADEDLVGVLLVTAEAVELRVPAIEWTRGSYGPALSSELHRRVEGEELATTTGAALIDELRGACPLATCAYCGERFLPSRMTGDACHGCAERHLGAVY